MTGPLDTRKLMAEIEADARARRVSGDVPRGFEAELNAKFAQLTPRGGESDFASEIQRASKSSFLDYAPPVASARKGGAAAKKGLSKLSAWYVRYVGQQVTAFAVSITNAVRLLGERVERLESQLSGADAAGIHALAEGLSGNDLSAVWQDALLSQFKAENGRVLVARAGNGALVRALVDQGASAYGVEPGDPKRIEDIDPTLELRSTELMAHLRTIPEPELAGVVLIGLVDELAVGAVYETLARLNETMLPGATLVVVTTDPEQWRRQHGGAVADLSHGHPLAPTTWRELLASQGFTDIEIRSAEPEAIVRDIPGTDPAVLAMNEQLRALEAAIAVSPSHFIRARRAE
jgi:hypothetical protein